MAGTGGVAEWEIVSHVSHLEERLRAATGEDDSLVDADAPPTWATPVRTPRRTASAVRRAQLEMEEMEV
jgi:hypothetical protein